MFDPDYALRRTDWIEISRVITVHRPSTRLVGAMRQGDSLVWSADTYESVLDDEFGILLRLAAKVGGSVIAEAYIVECTFNEAIDDRVFATDPPPGSSWMELG